MNTHLSALIARVPELEALQADIQSAFGILRDAVAAGNKFLLCGNGGSAADADHWSGELLKGFKKRRPLTAAQSAGLPPDLARKLQGGIRAIPLTGFVALNTAFGNDVDADLTFAQLVNALGDPGDVLIGISTSGNARNVAAAAEVGRARGLRVLGLTGRDGGRLKSLCDICLRMPSDETYRIQEMHLPLYHCLSLMLEDEFFG